MFGTSGIRGIVGKEVTPELALSVGKALQTKKVVVGRDARTSGIMLESALVAGVCASGGDVLKAGIIPTPTLALAARKHECYGVMITASHNPPEYNGIKLFENGMEISREEERKIEAKVNANSKSDWKKMGKIYSSDSAVREHIDLALSLVDVDLIRKKAPKVVVDCGNGAGSSITPLALRQAGCKVISVNSEPSGIFSRGLEPNEENLKETKEIVNATNSLMGIAHDGDADRAIIIDSSGELLGLDRQLAIMCRELLGKKKGKIISTIEASLAVREAVENAGGRIGITSVGSSYVAQQVTKQKAIFGGEPCGEYVFPEGILVPDGILSALKFVEIACKKDLQKLKSEMKIYSIKRAKYFCKNKEKAMEKIKRDLLSWEGNINKEDGVRIDGEDGWVLVRQSGTEPYIRITCENRSKEDMERTFECAEKTVKKYLR